MNTKELRDFMIDVSENGIGELAKSAAENVFRRVDKTSEDDLVITSAIAKKAFVDAFDIEYERLFIMTDADNN
ncbi:hypothetical protein P4T89_12985 [Bacillus nakamurai]|uniref:Uncharacterized protein n=1 Tax=Bacillus nakamurai TaxID=1793963 RepID=A0A150FAS5_9BACI|nr:hypothetical protein [Bacillus nakamurai]KXZ22347.1 hypothetical protein AXI58_10170 [Bacillus nakamurai]MED1228431.1 hypothetical protein [Bacillus nakamurai]